MWARRGPRRCSWPSYRSPSAGFSSYTRGSTPRSATCRSSCPPASTSVSRESRTPTPSPWTRGWASLSSSGYGTSRCSSSTNSAGTTSSPRSGSRWPLAPARSACQSGSQSRAARPSGRRRPCLRARRWPAASCSRCLGHAGGDARRRAGAAVHPPPGPRGAVRRGHAPQSLRAGRNALCVSLRRRGELRGGHPGDAGPLVVRRRHGPWHACGLAACCAAPLAVGLARARRGKTKARLDLASFSLASAVMTLAHIRNAWICYLLGVPM